MADYDEEIPFGVGVSARGVDPDTKILLTLSGESGL